ncbi:MAG: restriction endonuclease [Myxococcaceae bacterium]|nr:restriction endonuclease [Myxococcaceae bacterium]
MTFYEAAVRVLEEAGAPLNAVEITQRSMTQGLLSHIGKTPELTMLSRLAAMAKRPRDRKVMITAKDTFALSEWMLPEDPVAAASTGIIEDNPEEALPPLRPPERHPEPRAENARGLGRQSDRKYRSEERRRRYPPVAEVVYEIMSEAPNPYKPDALLHTARSRELASDDLNPEQLLLALLEDNQRRIDAGRRPHFVYEKTPEGDAQLVLDRNSERPVQDIQTVFATALNVPMQEGRVVLKSQAPQGPAAGPSQDDVALIQSAKHAVREARRAMARVMRRRLGQLEQGDFEKACVKLLHGEGFREVKVAKRAKEGPLMTARCREGNLELRYAVRVLKGGGSVERRHVQDLRRDLNHYGAHVGLICSSGDARGDARSEATGGGALIFLWCGDALAEKFFDAQVGVKPQPLMLFELDEAFFARVHQDAQEARARREERARDRGLEEDREGGPADSEQAALAGEGNGEKAAAAPSEEGNDAGGDDDGDDNSAADAFEGSAPTGAVASEPAGQGRRRRRRRRRRGGRGGANGPRPEGQAAAAVLGASPEGTLTLASEGVPLPAPAASAPSNDGPKEG